MESYQKSIFFSAIGSITDKGFIRFLHKTSRSLNRIPQHTYAYRKKWRGIKKNGQKYNLPSFLEKKSHIFFTNSKGCSKIDVHIFYLTYSALFYDVRFEVTLPEHLSKAL